MDTIKPWRTISIFVSSTFSDMQAERDYIRKYSIPLLEEYFNPKHVSIKFIDLRWGVNTRDGNIEDRDAEILRVCFNEIQRCRPFFLGLIGDRYGTIAPNKLINNEVLKLSSKEQTLLSYSEPKSITELEILLGALGCKEYLSRSIFFFRQADYSSLSSEQIKLYVESDETYKTKISLLRQNIYNSLSNEGLNKNLVKYSVSKWDSTLNQFDDLDEFGNKLYAHLKAEIEEELSLAEEKDCNHWYNEERQHVEEFIQRQTEYFVGRKELISSIQNMVKESPNTIFFTGDSGYGKSAIMCMLYKLFLNSSNEDNIILFHSAGISNKSMYIENMIQLFSYQIALHINERYEEVSNSSNSNDRNTIGNSYKAKIVDQFKLFANKATAMNKKIVVLIDAYDRFATSDNLTYLSFLPENISTVISTLPNYLPKLQMYHPNATTINIDYFTHNEALQYIELRSTRDHKNIHAKVSQKLMSVSTEGHYAYCSPLWLSLASDVIFSIDNMDFEKIRHRSEDDNEEKIENYLFDLIDNFPSDAGKLFIELLKRASDTFGDNLTNETFAYITETRRGLREKDLSVLIGDDWNELRFASMRRWFRKILVENGQDGKWYIAHNKIKEALKEHFSEDKTKRNYAIINHLQLLSADDPLRYEEILYHIWVNKDYVLSGLHIANIKQNNISSLKELLYYLYEMKYPLEEWLVNSICTLNDDEKCYFIGYIFKYALETFAVFNFNTYSSLYTNLRSQIDLDNVSNIESVRVLGAVTQDISLYAKNNKITSDFNEIVYKTQVYCYQIMIKNDPSNEIYKNSLCIGLMNLGEYYSAVGNFEKALETFSQIEQV
ncbi:MAG: DUF4062 domain-containing protein [Rikenellaceae bacterium]